MKKLLLWQKINVGLIELDKKLQDPDLTDVERVLGICKRAALVEVAVVMEFIGKSSEKSKLKYELWLNRGKNRKAVASELGKTTSALRAYINDFNNRLEYYIGKDTIDEILNCKTREDLDNVTCQYKKRISSVKTFFR